MQLRGPIIKERQKQMEWARLLAYITGTVDQELLLRNEYLAAENPPGVGEGHARRSPGRDPLCRWK